MNTETIPEAQACCAHCKVVLKHHEHPKGLRSDYWECADCGCRFIQASVMDTEVAYRADAIATLQKQCESLQQAASIDKTNIEWLNSERASLEKRCEALKTALADWHKLADQRSEALVKAQQQCEELRTRAEASSQWKNLATKLENALRCANNSFFGDSYSQKVIDKALEAFKKGPVDGEDGWKTRAEKAEAGRDELQKHILFQAELLRKAEAEVAELKVKLQMRSSEKFMERQAKEELQQDVKPLVALVCYYKKAFSTGELVTLETFITKYPELKP